MYHREILSEQVPGISMVVCCCSPDQGYLQCVLSVLLLFWSLHRSCVFPVSTGILSQKALSEEKEKDEQNARNVTHAILME